MTWSDNARAADRHARLRHPADDSVAFDVEIDPRSSGRIELRLEDPTGPVTAMVTIPADAVGRGWAHFTAPAPRITSVQALYLAFQPDRGELGDVGFFVYCCGP